MDQTVQRTSQYCSLCSMPCFPSRGIARWGPAKYTASIHAHNTSRFTLSLSLTMKRSLFHASVRDGRVWTVCLIWPTARLPPTIISIRVTQHQALHSRSSASGDADSPLFHAVTAKFCRAAYQVSCSMPSALPQAQNLTANSARNGLESLKLENTPAHCTPTATTSSRYVFCVYCE